MLFWLNMCTEQATKFVKHREYISSILLVSDENIYTS